MPPGQDYGGQNYGSPQGYGDPRMAHGRASDMSRHSEKGPSGGGRRVNLRVEKVSDKSLQSRLIYGNM